MNPRYRANTYQLHIGTITKLTMYKAKKNIPINSNVIKLETSNKSPGPQN